MLKVMSIVESIKTIIIRTYEKEKVYEDDGIDDVDIDDHDV